MNETELRDRLAVTLAKAQDADYWTAEIAEWEGHEVWQREAFPGEYPAMAYEDRSNYRDAAQAIIDDLGLTMESGDGQASPYGDGPITLDGMVRVVGRWEKQ